MEKVRHIETDFREELADAMDNKETVSFIYWTSQGKKVNFEGKPVKFCRKDGEDAFLFKTNWGQEIKLRLDSCGIEGKEHAFNLKFKEDAEELEWKLASLKFARMWTILVPAKEIMPGKNILYVEYNGKGGKPSAIPVPPYVFIILEINDMGDAKGYLSKAKYHSHKTIVADDGQTYYACRFTLNLNTHQNISILPCRISRTKKIYASYNGREYLTQELEDDEFFIASDVLE